MCEKGGFHLHKFVANDKDVRATIPINEQDKDLSNILQQDQPIGRTLEAQWCIENDTLQFRMQLQDKPLTRRGIASTVCSIFDPLKLVSPTLLYGRRIMQEMCGDSHDWDDPVPEVTRVEWDKWRNDTLSLAELKTIELHHFSDACLSRFGHCSYVKVIDDRGNVSSKRNGKITGCTT